MTRRVPLAPGAFLGRFEILALAGEGGMGDVYRALDTSLERPVALKRVRGGRPDDPLQERFRREALALAQLNHPGICQVYELAETEQGTFIVMEWVEGESLADRLGRGPLPWREAAEIVRQAADALAAAHAKGLVHRDLKPTNLMITPEGHLKVLDFGLVRFTRHEPDEPVADPRAAWPSDDRTLPGAFAGEGLSGAGRAITLVGTFMGTLGYTSPEQALARSVEPPSDIFGLGILAYEMVSGERPFKGEGRASLDAVVDNVREPLKRRQAPRRYRALVDRMLRPRPASRPTAEEVAREAAALLSPKGPLWWSTVSAATVAALVLAGYWFLGRGVLAGVVEGRPARVAILGFRNETGVPALTPQTELGLGDLVADRLRGSARMQVIGADALAQASQALRINPAEASPEDQLRLGRALGADLVLTGAVRREGGQDRLLASLRDLQGHELAQAAAEAPAGDPILAASPLAAAAARTLAKAVNPLLASRGPEPYTIPPAAFAAYASGAEAYRRGRYAEAEPQLEQAAFQAPEWTAAVAAYASTEVSLSRPQSDTALRWALLTTRREGNASGESSVLQLLGKRSLSLRQYAAADAFYTQALAIAGPAPLPHTAAVSLNGQGLVAQGLGDGVLARRKFEQALAQAGGAQDPIMETQILANLGNLALQDGDLVAAAARYRSAVATAAAIGDESGEALGLNNLGVALISMFRPAEAQEALQKALALREKNGELQGVISAQRNLGICALMAGRAEEARGWFSRSADNAVRVSSAYAEAQARFYLAELDRQADRLDLARQGLEQAAQLAERAKDPKHQGMALAAQAECLLRLGRTREG
ncbi:MAG TPA: protein kinase, partial [Holophagaceae bacterium]|nr:protein kinase [Holophagaceae bacterium]